MAKFKVGDRVRIVGGANMDDWVKNHIGKEAVIVRSGVIYTNYWKLDVVDEGVFAESHLEPITDAWAQDKVAQLVKQCMPVAA